MRPVQQTVFGPPNGNCLQACIASVLDRPLDDVPNFVAFGMSIWFEQLELWLAGRGQRMLCRSIPLMKSRPEGYHIVLGRSPRYPEWNHAVVCLDGEIVHDPHPENGGLLDAREVWRIVPLED